MTNEHDNAARNTGQCLPGADVFIDAMETPHANATVKRMARAARGEA